MPSQTELGHNRGYIAQRRHIVMCEKRSLFRYVLHTHGWDESNARSLPAREKWTCSSINYRGRWCFCRVTSMVWSGLCLKYGVDGENWRNLTENWRILKKNVVFRCVILELCHYLNVLSWCEKREANAVFPMKNKNNINI